MTENNRESRNCYLLPCPHDGGFADFHDSDDGGRYIECCKCGATTPLMYPLKESVDALLAERWNQRWTNDKEVRWLRVFASHVRENGGMCPYEEEPDVGIFFCAICYPDGRDYE